MTKPKPVPGTVTAKQTRDGRWMWRWQTPMGNVHLGPDRHDTEAKAMAAGRKFARRNSGDRRAEDDQ